MESWSSPQEPPWWVALLSGSISSSTFSVLGDRAWKLWKNQESMSLSWVLSKPVSNLAVIHSPVKMCCVVETDVCKGWRAKLSLVPVYVRAFFFFFLMWKSEFYSALQKVSFIWFTLKDSRNAKMFEWVISGLRIRRQLSMRSLRDVSLQKK